MSQQIQHQLTELQPEPDDLVVVPLGTKVPDGIPYQVYPMKFLHAPSIIRTRGYNVNALDKFNNSFFGQIFGTIFGKASQTEAPDYFRKVQSTEDGEYTQVSVQASGLGLNPDNTVVSSDIKSTDFPKFWRYVRPSEIVQKMGGTYKVGSAPKGGLAFYIELDAENKTFAFSYALCHNKDNFNYEIARQVSKGRFEQEDWYEVCNYDERIGVVENIAIALNNLFEHNGDLKKPEGSITFSSLSPKFNLVELKQVLKGINTK